MVVTNDQGEKFGLGNPAKDAFVRQFMRGLKKRKSTEFTQRQATPISHDMLRVLHCHFSNTSGFTEACRLWFVAVSAFAFYGMCRINEVLSLQWKNLTLGRTRKSTTDPSVSITFGIYKLEGRKTDVAEGRCYNLHHLDSDELPIDAFFHLSAWLKYVETKTDHTWSDTDYVFPALSKISKGVLKTKTPFTGCENVRVEWGKKMSEQAFITLLNCAVRDLNRNGTLTPGYIRQEWRDIWFTSHTFRRAGAQYRFMFAPPERRWSLRMVKWRAGWTQNESAETLVRYLLDQAVTDEDKQLADCLAPDRDAHMGCPTTYSGIKRTSQSSTGPFDVESTVEKRLKAVESSVKAIEDKLDILVSTLQSSTQPEAAPTTAVSASTDPKSIFPPAKDWKDMYRMYWTAQPSRHLFKPISKWTAQDRKLSGALPSRLSVAKLIAEDVRDFATCNGAENPQDAHEDILGKYAAYFTTHWFKVAQRRSANVLTIDTLARFIRMDRKRRLVQSKHAYA